MHLKMAGIKKKNLEIGRPSFSDFEIIAKVEQTVLGFGELYQYLSQMSQM